MHRFSFSPIFFGHLQDLFLRSACGCRFYDALVYGRKVDQKTGDGICVCRVRALPLYSYGPIVDTGARLTSACACVRARAGDLRADQEWGQGDFCAHHLRLPHALGQGRPRSPAVLQGPR